MPTLKLAKLNDGAEIFHTLQGEGVNTGAPAIFVRSSLCNLHCRWCDTDYTWNWLGTPWPHDKDGEPGYSKFDKAEYILELPATEVAEAVRQFPCTHVIMTGGEPLLQQAGWLAMIEALKATDASYTFEVETNGTQVPSAELDAHINQYNVSPKLANSGNAESLRVSEKSMRWFASSAKSWFKFVIAEDSDLEEILQLIERFSIPKEKILLMPEGRTPAEQQARRLWVANLCIAQGFRFCDRLHVQLWGDKRGV
ncbi:7-carboxy-7-deazaguanine synthase QueE [Persicirhabdus sediminis]|uniref:7-carboxy-7-deazaguanine synthase n=1 Tax=Persicirhabdus sediminis TaxID=454144 RepID=A0A8J7SIA4_9BACT|nr:7-carboxy-7-deazaguanine synthase QueE [Persicirhabdus sediminis]MBK1790439.1 7-carboxy-7-deazaguanine synthase QueE [Persicirhabdus sediminis]